ncbi:hypothetical protein FA95DRAFT_1577914 [Auriscalpium vulgare]|uniref:Uncharacterized protein n=1 Tax=Auriscalpium vulgare TaxID=40419 RepID=A0ACB8R505_9AGAM|nr:hypothetical protein FA95DRAFT_1577914 [Auriscalpium vulgare]
MSFVVVVGVVLATPAAPPDRLSPFAYILRSSVDAGAILAARNAWPDPRATRSPMRRLTCEGDHVNGATSSRKSGCGACAASSNATSHARRSVATMTVLDSLLTLEPWPRARIEAVLSGKDQDKYSIRTRQGEARRGAADDGALAASDLDGMVRRTRLGGSRL